MGNVFLPEQFKIVSAIMPQTGAATRTGDYVSLKNCKTAYVVVHQNMAGQADDKYATIYEATSTTGAGAVATTHSYKIWLNSNSTSSDTLVAQTDGYRCATAATATDQIMVFQIDPGQLTDTFDCINVVVTSTSTATNFAEAMYYLLTTYPAATPPAAIS